MDDVRSQKSLVSKWDIEKAYYYVSLGFSDIVMDRKGLGREGGIRFWGAYPPLLFAIIVNGIPKSSFKGQRCVR